MSDGENEERLIGGERTAVTRLGGIVFRESAPWTCSVHALLRHLEGVGYSGAPRVIGEGWDAKERETLSYVEGEVLAPAP